MDQCDVKHQPATFLLESNLILFSRMKAGMGCLGYSWLIGLAHKEKRK